LQQAVHISGGKKSYSAVARVAADGPEEQW